MRLCYSYFKTSFISTLKMSIDIWSPLIEFDLKGPLVEKNDILVLGKENYLIYEFTKEGEDSGLTPEKDFAKVIFYFNCLQFDAFRKLYDNKLWIIIYLIWSLRIISWFAIIINYTLIT